MIDLYKNHSRGLSSPAENAAPVTPDDLAPLGAASRALYVGQGGDLAVEMLGGESVVLGNVPAGALLPLRVARVRASGTTAGRIIALW
jgi:hypothetical protein